ncbi:hypothetical protein Tsubulata_006789 [Turnera subulata]|uniref:DUF4408 domain-containing protein n=1 Tax=Turnera subulata TaxID=218843 RepID=A0A9Q0G589_9ROSI|nr:hypothetical protein Tsubulata_006789 [Turnera subulata]
MVFPTSSSGNPLVSAKAALVSSGVVAVAVILKFSAPAVAEFAVSELPGVYSGLLSWLQPPYLYLVINCIIISIVASSKLHLPIPNHHRQQQHFVVQPVADEKVSDGEVLHSDLIINGGGVLGGFGYGTIIDQDQDELNMEKRKVDDEDDTTGLVVVDGGGNKMVGSNSSRLVGKPPRCDSMELLLLEKLGEKDKPLASKRFGQRKYVKTTPEGGGRAAALGVSRSKRHDTLESTWKTITEGRPMPLARHLKKSDTWDSHVRRDNPTNNPTNTPPSPTKMKKSQTFDENKEQLSRQGSGKLKREPSPSQDELNRRVEAFIKKFNEEMRLQRQESLNQFQEMISRGAY